MGRLLLPVELPCGRGLLPPEELPCGRGLLLPELPCGRGLLPPELPCGRGLLPPEELPCGRGLLLPVPDGAGRGAVRFPVLVVGCEVEGPEGLGEGAESDLIFASSLPAADSTFGFTASGLPLSLPV